MSEAIWWIGAVHIAVYAAIGCFMAITFGMVKLSMWFRVFNRIVQWHVAQARWNRRHEDGLSDSEWKRGEPVP